MSAKTYLLSALTVLAVSSPLLAESKKADTRREALVTAVQAVSPDALGGRLGLEIASAMAPKAPAPAPVMSHVAKATEGSTDLLGYQSWKRAKKS